jgi:hypothetical protein
MATHVQSEQQKCQSAFIQQYYVFWYVILRWKYSNFEVLHVVSSIYEGYAFLGYDAVNANRNLPKFRRNSLLLTGPWRWKQYFPPKHGEIHKILPGVRSQKTVLFINRMELQPWNCYEYSIWSRMQECGINRVTFEWVAVLLRIQEVKG